MGALVVYPAAVISRPLIIRQWLLLLALVVLVKDPNLINHDRIKSGTRNSMDVITIRESFSFPGFYSFFLVYCNKFKRFGENGRGVGLGVHETYVHISQPQKSCEICYEKSQQSDIVLICTVKLGLGILIHFNPFLPHAWLRYTNKLLLKAFYFWILRKNNFK